MEDIIDLFIQLAFETGQAYQRIFDTIGLSNVIDFKDIAFANSKGAQWNIKGKMQDLPELFKTKDIKPERIKALNEMSEQLQQIKLMAKQQLLIKEMEVMN